MSENSNIEWTDHTWSPWDGCTKVSPGCKFCYAEARDKRHLIEDVDHWGKGAPRRLRKDWNSPIKWNKEAATKSCGFCDYDEAEGELIQQCSKCAMRPKVFPSLCDWLDDEVPNLWLGRFLGLVNSTPNLTWQLLTKRPELFESRMKSVAGEEMPWAILARRWLDGNAPSNVWVGTSVEDQEWAAKRVPALLQIPAQLRFISVEPLLGPVNLAKINDDDGNTLDAFSGDWGIEGRGHTGPNRSRIDWVIIGGESGRNARPCNVDWVRSIVTQCADAGVPCFVKQLGARPVVTVTRDQTMPDDFRSFSHPKGGDPSEWPEEFRVREVPSDS